MICGCNQKEKLTKEMLEYQNIVNTLKEKETKNSYPSIGILDDPLHLVTNQIDVKNNYAKGIILVGYLSTKKEPKNYHDTFRLYLNYKTEDGKNKTIYYEKKI